MLYLTTPLGRLRRSITGSAARAFQGPHRWWKLASYAAVFILPGGSLGVLLFAWLDGRRGRARHDALPAESQTSGDHSTAATQPA